MRRVMRYFTAAVGAFAGLALSNPSAIAHPSAALSRLTPAQIQRISRDLNRSNAEDFFRRGQEKLEREVRLLDRNRNLLTEDLLKIDQNPQLQPESTTPNAPQRSRDRSISE